MSEPETEDPTDPYLIEILWRHDCGQIQALDPCPYEGQTVLTSYDTGADGYVLVVQPVCSVSGQALTRVERHTYPRTMPHPEPV